MTDLTYGTISYPSHLTLTRANTPIIPLNRYTSYLKDYQIWLKRDDLTGVELSGNKVRKLDFLAQEALDQNSTHLITCGGLHSNHCRTTAYIGIQNGLKVVLVLRGEKPHIAYGNYFLDRLCGAHIEFITPETYVRVESYMKEYAENNKGSYYIIPEGGSNPVGAWGYVKCYHEILEQNQKKGLDLDTIVVATGSGGTHAGLLLGKLLTGGKINIISINVCDSAVFFKRKINKIMEEFCRKYSYSLSWSQQDIRIVDGFVGEGYGLISEKEVNLIKSIASTEGVVIDPVYGAKAFLGMEDQLKKGILPGNNILFIHTGGIFGTFPLWKKFLTPQRS